MKIRFWGTRGSIAKPGPTTVRYGGNTSCVEIRSSGGTLIVLDCGTGGHGLGQAIAAEEDGPRRGHILISHTHWDHIQGVPFFAPLFMKGMQWSVYGPRGLGPSMGDILAGQMQYTYFPVTPDAFQANVTYRNLVEGSFEIGDIRVTAQYLNHPALTLGYRLEVDGVTVVYSTDHEPHSRRLAGGGRAPPGSEDEKHCRFLEDADFVIHDSQYTAEEYPAKVGWGHSTMEYVVDSARSARVRHLALFHHDPLRTDDDVDALLVAAQARGAGADHTVDVSAAAEGTTVSLEGESRPRPEAPMSATSDPAAAPLERAVLFALGADPALESLTEAAEVDGVRVLIAADPAHAVEIAGSTDLSLAMLGAGLPDTDPLALARDLRTSASNAGRQAPTVVVVADTEEQVDTEASAGAGVSDWLVKPFTGTYARTRIRAWLMRTACRWTPAPAPVDEAARISALHDLGILDTPPEERFDRHTRIAAAALDMPIALVSLVDTNRQWFKSRLGLEPQETPRDMSFCAYAILDQEVFIVPDALLDPRFADNPLVTGEPRARFYAGVPLTLADGNRIGTLCVFDRRPRELSEQEVRVLRDLGRLVESELRTTAPAWTTEPT